MESTIHFLIFHAASHLPYNRNGFKFFTNAGGLGKPDIKDILVRAANICVKFLDASVKESIQSANATVKKVDYMAVYTSDLVAAVRKAAGNTGTTLFSRNSTLYDNLYLWTDSISEACTTYS